VADPRRSEGDQSTGSHSRDSRGLVLASLGAPGDVRSAVLEAADLTVPTTAPLVILTGADPPDPDRAVRGTSAHPTGLRSGLSCR
jgi:hypothetical protein